MSKGISSALNRTHNSRFRECILNQSTTIMASKLILFIALSMLVTLGNTQGTWSPATGGRPTWQNQQGGSNSNTSPLRPFGTVPPPSRTPTSTGNINNYPQTGPQSPYGNSNNYPQTRPPISTGNNYPQTHPQQSYGNNNNYNQTHPQSSYGNSNINNSQTRPQSSNGAFNNPSATRPFGTVPPPRHSGNTAGNTHYNPANNHGYGTNTPQPQNWNYGNTAGNTQYSVNDHRYGTNTPQAQNWNYDNWNRGDSRPNDGYRQNSTGLYPSLSGIRN